MRHVMIMHAMPMLKILLLQQHQKGASGALQAEVDAHERLLSARSHAADATADRMSSPSLPPPPSPSRQTPTAKMNLHIL